MSLASMKFSLSQDKIAYHKLCESEPSIPLDSQAWLLDAVCDDWRVIMLKHKQEFVAALPFAINKKRGKSQLMMPAMTKYLGPWLRYRANQKYATRISFEHAALQQLLQCLPDAYKIDMHCHYKLSNWLPFYWQDFQQTTRYTYTIEGLNDLDEVLSRFTTNRRNRLKQAEKLLSIKTGLDLNTFYQLNQMTFAKQNQTPPYSLSQLAKKDAALAEHNAREIFYAVDSDNNIHAALYLTWDKLSSYIHMIGHDKNYSKSNASLLLTWAAIKYTKQQLQLDKLDFEGSMIPSIEILRRECGGVQTPYFQIRKKRRAKLSDFFRSKSQDLCA